VQSVTNKPKQSSFPQVMDPNCALAMRRIIADVPVRGTARGAGSDTWNIFGKTGTAHISIGKGGYSDTKFTSSFICGAPAENPRLVAVFVVHEANKKIAHYGGAVAAPNASRMIERSLAYLQVPRSPDLQPPPPAIANVLWGFDPKVYSRTQQSASASAHD
jgi:cell division protein FtsI/penicillin-binding protein 2